MKPGFETSNSSQTEREKIEEKRPVSLGREGDHLTARLAHRLVEDPLQVGGFPPKPGP